MPPELYVLRHGETLWNAQGRMQGALNSPLTELGRAQAARQGEIFKRINLERFDVFCSPQGRAIETAAIAVAPWVKNIVTDQRLREIEVGDWQGKLRAELRGDNFFDATPEGELALYTQAPNGEGFAALEARCSDFLQSLQNPSILITHSITSRMLRALTLGLGRSGLIDMPCGQGVIYHLRGGVQKRLT